MDEVRQRQLSSELVEFLAAFDANVKQMIGDLEEGVFTGVDLMEQRMLEQDLGAHLLPASFELTEPTCVERLVESLRTLEEDLTRAGALADEVDPNRNFFIGRRLDVVRSVLNRIDS